MNTIFKSKDEEKENEIKVSIVVDDIEDIDDKILRLLEKEFFSSDKFREVDIEEIFELDD